MYEIIGFAMLKRKKVLIVDDDGTMRLLILEVLKKLSFVDFFEAENGEEAVKIAYKERPHLILMDIIMPKMDGYEACRQIKNNPELHSSIIIFMTAVGTDGINEKIIDAGGEDILRKPLDTGELYFRVKNYLMLAKARANNFGIGITPVEEHSGHTKNIDLGRDFFYQVEAKILRHNDRYIPLMKQEILLLEELIAHRNQILTYEQILRVISIHGESTIANIRTLIKLIRSKTYKELITTLPSIGYRLF